VYLVYSVIKLCTTYSFCNCEPHCDNCYPDCTALQDLYCHPMTVLMIALLLMEVCDLLNAILVTVISCCRIYLSQVCSLLVARKMLSSRTTWLLESRFMERKESLWRFRTVSCVPLSVMLNNKLY